MTTSLQTKLTALADRGVSAQLCQDIGALIRDGEPAQLARLSPPRLAPQWKRPEPEVLEAFLHATRVGLFDLEWNLRCPACSGPTASGGHLAELNRASRCRMCSVDYQASFDEAVEVVWRVHPSLRDLSGLDCAAAIMAYSQPRPVLAVDVAAGASVAQDLELAPGNYHLLTADFRAARGLHVEPATDAAGGELELTLDDAGLERGDWNRQAGRYRLRLHNRSTRPAEFKVARLTDQPWVSGARLASHQSFRDLFSSELIRPDESFAIRHATFVFTDLKGSTELYERIGDSRAYALVRDHFAIMIEQVRQHGGALVKTIGDAIMASFVSAPAAVRFAVDVLTAFDAFNAANRTRDSIIVKVGIHAGPCIAVTLNDRLDYFGRTVNLAARIQGLSEGRDLVLSQSVASDGEVREVLEGTGWAAQRYAAQLKGIEGACEVVRLQQAQA